MQDSLWALENSFGDKHTPNQLQAVQSHYPNVQLLHLNVKLRKSSCQCAIVQIFLKFFVFYSK